MTVVLTTYCVLLIAVSITGGLVSQWFHMNHRRTQMVLSLVAGVMLGVAFLHLLPHAVTELSNTEWVFGATLAGLLFMFFMIRMFHFHQHDAPCTDRTCDDHHHHHGNHLHQHVSWAGLTLGLGVHSMLDGIALAAAFRSEIRQEILWPGVGIFLAIVLHKPLDALFITSLMKARNINLTKRRIANITFSLICPLGVLLAISGIAELTGEWQSWVLGVTLAFSAGVFICISLSDLLPEVQFHTHDRFALSGMMILGICIAIGLEIIPGR